eukprot:5471420-Alexandrium_andersonii.AAC.2
MARSAREVLCGSLSRPLRALQLSLEPILFLTTTRTLALLPPHDLEEGLEPRRIQVGPGRALATQWLPALQAAAGSTAGHRGCPGAGGR